jgi:lipopolysaccharide export system permease protein
MGSIGWYIFRTTFGAFLIVLGSLTPIIWVTQALRDIDLMTTQGQSALVFIGITSLLIPVLVLMIAPIALFIAVAHVLNKLGSDSEIIIMNAAGMSPWRIFRAFMAVALVVSLIVAVIGAYVSPKSLRMLREWMAQARTNLIANIIQPGRFTKVEGGLTFHIRERLPNGVLAGIVVDDVRQPKERITIIAEQGEVHEKEGNTFLILANGNIQRQEAGQRDPTIVLFEQYAIDMSRFSISSQRITYTAREQYLWQLAFPDFSDPLIREGPAHFRVEFHDRIAAMLYPLAFVVIIYAYFGAPQTNRQSRTLSFMTALMAVTVLRLIGFASSAFGFSIPSLLALQYVALIVVMCSGLYAISRAIIIEPPALVTKAAASITQLFARRLAQT